MDNQTMFYLALIALPFLALVIYGIATRPKLLTGSATVVSHRLELSKAGSRWSDNWNRLVTFRLSDGTELELYTTKEEYEALTDGQTGLLTWDKDQLHHFDPDT